MTRLAKAAGSTPLARQNDPLDGTGPQTATIFPDPRSADDPLTVEAPLYGGGFTARSRSGTSNTLPFVLPGEQVLAAAPMPAILSPSSSRSLPRCPHFGPCGGCHYQHADATAQLALKRRILLDIFAAAGITDLPDLQTHAADPWLYRNRIRLHLWVSPAGSFEIGYHHRSSSALLPIHTCPIAAPLLLRAAQALVALAPQIPDAPAWFAAAGELELFSLPDESRLQLILLLRTPPTLPPARQQPSFTALCEGLHHVVPELAGAAADLLPPDRANAPRSRGRRRSAAAFTPPAWGSDGLHYPVPTAGDPAHSLWVSRGSFFQVNRFLLPQLLTLAAGDRSSVAEGAAASARGTLAWDLFAGVGLFTRSLSHRFDRVVAVESSRTASADLNSAHLPNVRVVASTVLDFLRSAVIERDRPELILLDPPRTGLGPEAAQLLTRLHPARITYVSCDPTSLLRDLRVMLSSGYNLAELHLVDMFPQTFHLETIAHLHRNATLRGGTG